jgi:hypothetical protein
MIPRLLYTLKLIRYQILRNKILLSYCKKFQIIHIFQFEFVCNNVFQKSFKYGNVCTRVTSKAIFHVVRLIFSGDK